MGFTNIKYSLGNSSVFLHKLQLFTDPIPLITTKKLNA